MPKTTKAPIWTPKPIENKSHPALKRPVIFPTKTAPIPVSKRIKMKSASRSVPKRLSIDRTRERSADNFYNTTAFKITLFE
jgi:hypothetical protein